MNIISLHLGHGCAITFYQDGKYHTIEAERLFRERYMGLLGQGAETFKKQIGKMMDVSMQKWGIRNDFDICTYTQSTQLVIERDNVPEKMDFIKNMVRAKEYMVIDHHLTHASTSFYLSPYESALIVSYDGAGNDGVFNIYLGSKEKGIELIEQLNIHSMGKAYRRPAYVLREIEKAKDGKRLHQLALPGKLMGLSAYGKVREEWVDAFRGYYLNKGRGKGLAKLSNVVGAEFVDDRVYMKNAVNNQNDSAFKTYDGSFAHDIARTNQHVYEEVFVERILPYVASSDINVCISGGCAYNVLANEKLRQAIGDRVFVPPNPDDSGLSLGQSFYVNPPRADQIKNIAYSGLPILDIEKLSEYIATYGGVKTNPKDMVGLLKDGNIIGIVQGDSEIGARALGNRSIICDASFPGMKDKINKIKHREPYRPFAPMVRIEDANKYFHFTHESPYMSFAPMVRDEYRDMLPAITHVDGTARLQTVSKEQNPFIHELLSRLDGVLLNTSFNIQGRPILTTIEDAVHVLETTSLDYLFVEGYLFKRR